MDLERRPHQKGAAPILGSVALLFLACLFVPLAVGFQGRDTHADLPGSRTRVVAPKRAARLVLTRTTQTGDVAYRFSDGEGATRLLSGASDVYLAALRVASADPSRPFLLEADAAIRYRLVDNALEQLRRAGVRDLILLTRQGPPRSGG